MRLLLALILAAPASARMALQAPVVRGEPGLSAAAAPQRPPALPRFLGLPASGPGAFSAPALKAPVAAEGLAVTAAAQAAEAVAARADGDEAAALGAAFENSSPGAAPSDPFAELAPVMELQGEVVSAAGRALGTDHLVVSLLLSALRDGFSLGDWARLKGRFEALEASRAEIWAAVEAAVDSTELASALAPGRPAPAPEKLSELAFALKHCDRNVVIRRNNDFLGWLYKWQAGEAVVRDTSFSGAQARLDGRQVHLELGVLRSGGREFPLRLTAHLDMGALGTWLRSLLASPFVADAHRRQLEPLVGQLKGLGVLASGFSLTEER